MTDWRKFLSALAACLFIAMVALSIWNARRRGEEQPVESGQRQKAFTVDVAEGLRIHDYRYNGVELISFGSCRIEKLKRGAIAFGAFNVLVIDDFALTLVPGREPAVDITDEASRNEFLETFNQTRNLTTKKFSSIQINGLAVNRWIDGKVLPLFTAASAKAGIGSGEVLQLEQCRVFENSTNGTRVANAFVRLKPEAELVFMSGGRKHSLPLQPP